VNKTLLIHAIVRQTMVLIAALATSEGRRTPLTNIADEVFASLVSELGELGLGNKVIADMFGMALRTYHRRAARMSGSDTEQGRSLWEAVLAHVRTAGPVSRAEVLARFNQDDELVVRSVLRDLIDSGLVYQTGREDRTSYRVTETIERAPDGDASGVDQLLLVTLHQRGPMTLTALLQSVPVTPELVAAAVSRLRGAGRISTHPAEGPELLRCEEMVIPYGEQAGWEAAVFDHYQAMVAALLIKLRQGSPRSSSSDHIGGSTFAFDLWPTHPFAEEILGFLKSVRERGSALRTKLEAYNAENAKPAEEPAVRVTTYVGQSVK
jgi:hypothetical protein